MQFTKFLRVGGKKQDSLTKMLRDELRLVLDQVNIIELNNEKKTISFLEKLSLG